MAGSTANAPSQVGALLHAARQLVRVVVLEAVEPDPSQPLAGDRQGLRARHLQALQTVGDVDRAWCARAGVPGPGRPALGPGPVRTPGARRRGPRPVLAGRVHRRGGEALSSPYPVGPTTATNSFEATVKLTSSSTRVDCPSRWLDEVLADAPGFYPREVRGEGCGGAPGRYHRDAWGRGRQASRRASTRVRASLQNMPKTAIRPTPTNTFSTWTSRPPRAMTEPSPAEAMMNSPTTTPTRARPIPSRSPAMMNGRQLGRHDGPEQMSAARLEARRQGEME